MPIGQYLTDAWKRVATDYPNSLPALATGVYNDLTRDGTEPPNLVEQGREQFSGDPLGAFTSAAAYGPLAVSPSFRNQAQAAEIAMPGMLVGPLYHGTTKVFSEFAQPKYKRNMQVGFGTHLTSNPEFASKYAEGPGGNVHKVVADVEKVLDADKIYNVTDPEFAIAKDLMKGTGYTPATSGGQFMIPIDNVSPQKAEKVLRFHGYDALKYKAKQITLDRPGYYLKGPKASSISVLNPQSIKPAWSVPSDQVVHGLDELGQLAR